MLKAVGTAFIPRLFARWTRPQAVTTSGPVDDGYLDLRSLAAAAGAWIAAGELVQHDPLVARTLTVALGFVLVSLFWVLLRNRGLLAWSHHWWTPVAAAAVGVFLVAAAISTHSLTQRDPTFAALAASSSTVRVEAVITGDPRWVKSHGTDAAGESIIGQQGPERVEEPATTLLVDVRILKYSAAGNWHAGAAEAVLVMDRGHITDEDPAPGRIVSGLARLSLADPGERQGYWLRAAASMHTHDAGAQEPLSEEWRRRFARESQVLPGHGPALLPGMVMGDRSAQDAELDTAMKTAGLAHLTAVSGANVAMILGSVLWLCRFCGVNRWLALGASLLTLVGFVILVHPEPSVIRAAVMGAVGAVAVYLGRGRQALTALCLCVCGVLAWDPWYAREPAFQLSALATAGIVLMGQRLGALGRRIMPGWLADGVAISTSAQLFCLPVLLGMNPAFSLYAVPANVVAAPIVPLVTVVGMSALVLCAVPGPWAQPLIWIAGIPTDWIGRLGHLINGLPAALLPWPEGMGGRGAAVLLASLALISVWLAATPPVGGAQEDTEASRPRQQVLTSWLVPGNEHFAAPGRRTVAVAAALACLGLLAGITVPATSWWPPPQDGWQVAACDVGQGDSFVLRSTPDHAVLIDTGTEPAIVDDCLSELGVQTIDALFITHLHADHAGGVAGAVRGRTVERAFFSTGTNSTELPGLPPGLEATKPRVGDSGTAGPVSWEMIGPIGDPRGEEENNASLVVVFTIAGHGLPTFTLLATGDLEEKAMDAVIRTQPDLRVDVLKVSHHGAKNGGTAIIDQSGARVALIGVGAENSYGHPTPMILKALQQAGMHCFRTDLNGTIRLRASRTGELIVTGRSAPASGR